MAGSTTRTVAWRTGAIWDAEAALFFSADGFLTIPSIFGWTRSSTAIVGLGAPMVA